MLPPLLRTVLAEPELVLEHAQAYAALASSQGLRAVQDVRARAQWLGIAAALAFIGLSLGGVALMLAAAIPSAQMPAAWALWALPAGCLFAAGVAWMIASSKRVSVHLGGLRAQWRQDLALLRELGQES